MKAEERERRGGEREHGSGKVERKEEEAKRKLGAWIQEFYHGVLCPALVSTRKVSSFHHHHYHKPTGHVWVLLEGKQGGRQAEAGSAAEVVTEKCQLVRRKYQE